MRVLLIDVDAMRPGHLGCYGYERNTSPNIDSVAADGMTFENHHCSDAPCLPSRTSLMTGRFGIHSGVVNHGGLAADLRPEGASRDMEDRLSKECLPAVFRKNGMHTALISTFAERHTTWNFYAGFNEIHNIGRRGRESAEEVTPTVMKWLNSNAEKDDWFLYVNYWDPHTPYRTPVNYPNNFENEPMPAIYTEELLEKHLHSIGPHTSQELYSYHSNPKPNMPHALGKITDMKDLKTFIDGYDMGVNYADLHIGKIISWLKENDLYEETAIIITADHGENLGELGIYGEHATADEATTRIPFIIKWPGVKAGTRNTGLHYSLDLAPTLAEIFDLPQSDYWDGESFKQSLFENPKEGRPELIVSQCAHVCQRSVRFDDWIYIRTYHDGYYLFPREQLYNLKLDPFELENVADKNPAIVRDAVYRLNNWYDWIMQKSEYEVDPLWTVIREGGPHHARGHLKEYIKRLNETGRSWAVEELLERHPKEFY